MSRFPPEILADAVKILYQLQALERAASIHPNSIVFNQIQGARELIDSVKSRLEYNLWVDSGRPTLKEKQEGLLKFLYG